ncbi:MAG: trypsin-like peptidase domain-containing protein [Opitutae bacterium]|nr:trypsin-like peptidase domain-containing protein [Opitutae bacterium]
MRIKFASVSLFCFSAFSFLLTSNTVYAASQSLQEDLYRIYDEYESAIVRVKAAFRQQETEDKPSQINLRIGTGFFVSKEGHVLVNASRALGAYKIGIEYQNTVYPAEAIGHDPVTNISLLRLINKPKAFGVVPLTFEKQNIALGSFVFSLACPLDFDVSPIFGILSGVDKKLGDSIFPTAYYRTSITIGSGQGGSPVFDLNGRLIGMTIASIPDMNGSYCLPVSALARVKEDLMVSGKSLRGWIGLEVRENISDQNKNNVYISKINESGPAELAGLEVGDNIVSLCEVSIAHISDLPSATFKTYINQLSPIKILRDGKVMEFTIKATERPSANIDSQSSK